jgi:hypothetical protein
MVPRFQSGSCTFSALTACSGKNSKWSFSSSALQHFYREPRAGGEREGIDDQLVYRVEVASLHRLNHTSNARVHICIEDQLLLTREFTDTQQLFGRRKQFIYATQPALRTTGAARFLQLAQLAPAPILLGLGGIGVFFAFEPEAKLIHVTLRIYHPLPRLSQIMLSVRHDYHLHRLSQAD